MFTTPRLEYHLVPLIFAENEVTESGISYEDRTGVSYQYPSRYRLLIQPVKLAV